ncbi:MAG: LysR family transcriptional regulator, partial [Lachnospiraceae bacterium]|nr:LysR family transcriptional regulator [Lachnospiraceae bacterium]
MDIESIKTFMVLAHTKNYTRAANQLFVAQSTVTNRIHELERELGFSLFKRTNRSVELTPEGEKFRLYGEKVIELT